MDDETTIVGIVGTLSSFGLGTWNNVIGICAGLFTCSWIAYKFLKERRGK